MDERLTFERRCWYAMTMLPGYGDDPYVSPVRVDDVTPRGSRMFELTFLNLGYAAGVQGFKSIFRTLKRGRGFILAEQLGKAERGYIFQNLTPDWLEKNLGPGSAERFLSDDGSPNERRLLASAATPY
jgi:hypothetical protein